MGENEQGGMLRTVVVIGLIAMIAVVVIFGITGLKSNMSKNSDTAVGAVVRTTKAVSTDASFFTSFSPDTSGWQGPRYRLPYVGDIPANNWRDVKMDLVANTVPVSVSVDINDYLDPVHVDGNVNDFDSRRKVVVTDIATNTSIYLQGGTSSTTNASSATLTPGRTYSLEIQYFNGTSGTIYDAQDVNSRTSVVFWVNTSVSTSPVDVSVKNIEAATYDNKYYVG